MKNNKFTFIGTTSNSNLDSFSIFYIEELVYSYSIYWLAYFSVGLSLYVSDISNSSNYFIFLCFFKFILFIIFNICINITRFINYFFWYFTCREVIYALTKQYFFSIFQIIMVYHCNDNSKLCFKLILTALCILRNIHNRFDWKLFFNLIGFSIVRICLFNSGFWFLY